MSSVFSALVCGFTDDGELITDPDELQEKVCLFVGTRGWNNTSTHIDTYTQIVC